MADIPYINYAVKYPDTNLLGAEDIFFAKDDTSLEQTRGVLSVTVSAVNANSIPMGGGDATSLNAKIKAIDAYNSDITTTVDAVKSEVAEFKNSITNAVEDSDTDITNKFNKLEFKMEASVSAFVKEYRDIARDLDSRIIYVEKQSENISKLYTAIDALKCSLEDITSSIMHEYRSIAKDLDNRLLVIESKECNIAQLEERVSQLESN